MWPVHNVVASVAPPSGGRQPKDKDIYRPPATLASPGIMLPTPSRSRPSPRSEGRMACSPASHAARCGQGVIIGGACGDKEAHMSKGRHASFKKRREHFHMLWRGRLTSVQPNKLLRCLHHYFHLRHKLDLLCCTLTLQKISLSLGTNLIPPRIAGTENLNQAGSTPDRMEWAAS